MDEALIIQIVTRVLAELKSNYLGQNYLNQLSPVKSRLLVLSDDNIKLSSQLSQIFSEYQEEYEICFVGKDNQFILPEGGHWVQAEDVKGFKWDRVYFASCSVNSLIKIALGLREGFTAELIGIALTKGTPVDMETPDFGFTAFTQDNYRSLLEGYLAQIISYGIRVRSSISKFTKSDNYLVNTKPFQREQIVPSIIVPAAKELILSPAIPQNLGSTNNLDETLVKYYQEGYMKDAAAEREIIKYEKRLLTERDANKLPSGSIVLLVKNNVVTPLAKDVIRSRKIELRVQGEESR